MLILGMAVPAWAESDPAGGGSAAPSASSSKAEAGAPTEAPASEPAAEPADTTRSGGAEYGATTGSQTSTNAYPVVPGYRARLMRDGRAAAPAMAPAEVQRAVWAANRIVGKPYVYGGGHTPNFKSRGYDCSGTISYALHGGRMLRSPLDSGSFMRWGAKGKGAWITVYTNPGHAYVVIAGLRLDTSAAGDPSGAKGPRWRPNLRETRGYAVRHPRGF